MQKHLKHSDSTDSIRTIYLYAGQCFETVKLFCAKKFSVPECNVHSLDLNSNEIDFTEHRNSKPLKTSRNGEHTLHLQIEAISINCIYCLLKLVVLA